MNGFWNRVLALWLMLCLLPAAVLADEETAALYPSYPEELQMVVQYEDWTAENGRGCSVGIPVTCREDVNAALRTAQQELWVETMQHAEETDEVEMMATFRVSGDRWAGFLLTGRVVREINVVGGNDYDETIHLAYRVMSYDMQTGQTLTLADVFPEDSAAWDMLAQEAEKLFYAYYAQQPRSGEAVAQWCSKENLTKLAFLPSAGRLLIHAPLWASLEGRNQLIPISLYYPDYREYMNEAAQAQTDNSHRPIVAVTYDDGPSVLYTPKILHHLATYGASATFFIVANKMLGLADGVRSAMDYGHSVGSHTYDHVYEYQARIRELRENREMCLEAHREKLGIEPLLFRAPGGHYDKYVEYEIGWPLIMWSYSAGDTGSNNAYQLAQRIIRGSENGDILLMHDIREKTAKGSQTFLAEMTQMGFMFATVEELLYLNGYQIEPNKVYSSAYTPVEPTEAE